MQIDDASGLTGFIPLLGEVALLPCPAGLRSENDRRLSIHAIEHGLESLSAGDIDTPAALALAQAVTLPIIVGPGELAQVTLTLPGMQREDERPLHFDRRNFHEGVDVLGQPDLI